MTESLLESSTAFSLTAFLINAQPKSRLSRLQIYTILSFSLLSNIDCYSIISLRLFYNDYLNGSLHVTNANDPANS